MKLENIITSARRELLDQEEKLGVSQLLFVMVGSICGAFYFLSKVSENLNPWFWLSFMIIVMPALWAPFRNTSNQRTEILHRAIRKMKSEATLGEACMLAEAKGWPIRNMLIELNSYYGTDYPAHKYYEFLLERAKTLTKLMSSMLPGETFEQAKKELDLLCATKTWKVLRTDNNYCERPLTDESRMISFTSEG